MCSWLTPQCLANTSSPRVDSFNPSIGGAALSISPFSSNAEKRRRFSKRFHRSRANRFLTSFAYKGFPTGLLLKEASNDSNRRYSSSLHAYRFVSETKLDWSLDNPRNLDLAEEIDVEQLPSMSMANTRELLCAAVPLKRLSTD